MPEQTIKHVKDIVNCIVLARYNHSEVTMNLYSENGEGTLANFKITLS